MTTTDFAALPGLIADAGTWLLDQYGTCTHPVRGYSYHNHTHGRDVARAASAIAAELHDAGQVPAGLVPLAGYAGWVHDAHQGHGHEARSADHAEQQMRRAGMDPTQIALVRRMIAATQVTGVCGCRLVQAADPADLPQAILADADLSSLGSRDGVHRALLLDQEQQHLAGSTTPDREVTLRFLAFQVGLFDGHRYLLPVTERLYPHRQANADLLAHLADLYAADRISHAGLLARARA
ncbi:hypothetical protein ACN28G_19785 [Micromonospora sp. WMMA1923]|uniref:hypothetical protein n=1 Tax=Micromonospora sp. WMMA1923 TaxID=3404125 RepID=UPI003B949BE2